MKTLCSMALKTVLLCACFSSVLFACEDGETVEPTEKKAFGFLMSRILRNFRNLFPKI